ncbi:MAG: GNAT family N-acetyltransferase [Rhodobacteraceae bacterium]|jgi:GNAT superfamily N-acetyltransferase|uniref:GNAT family N-acetyltransferase n=1 Tax=Albidovulum sp. TaxID=1872424 RepID=UPI001DCC598C|nr:GNAT family N-acetyltransferase [uncultured Defluviimonas sp.]MCB2126884.1 GNAT family N-acetyltransferase [Paracoccaceae bacterium]MCC0069753.1 GNAT family N-acetyltransferase [Paracoccaceae bacterium]
MLIRALDPGTDVPLVEALYAEAADYWLLADRAPPDRAKAEAFFTDTPPGADAARSHRLGLFVEGRLSGVAELSFGFPEPADAYLGLMILAPRLRGKGYGARFLAHLEALARQMGGPRLCLGVLEANPRGRAFWQREGFVATGVTRHDAGTGHDIRRFVKPL